MSSLTPLRRRLREALLTAMKSRDRVAVGALRSALAAIGNAEAVGVGSSPGLAIEQSPVGVGAAEAERREVTEADAERIVRAEVTAREVGAREYEAVGRADRAELLRAEARVLLAHLPSGSPPPRS